MQTSSYDTHHPVFDLALNGYVPTGGMVSAPPPEQHQPQYGLGSAHGSQQSSSLNAWATPSPAMPSTSPDSRLGNPDGHAGSPPRRGMAELSRYQQLMAAKFPSHRPSAENESGSSGRGLYGDQQRQQSPSGLAYDPDIQRVIAAFPDPSSLGPDGKPKTAYQPEGSYPLVSNLGHFSSDSSSYRAFAVPPDAYADQQQQQPMQQQQPSAGYASSFDAGPPGAGQSALGLQGLPDQWAPSVSGYGGEVMVRQKPQQGGMAPWSTVAPQQMAYASSTVDYADGHGGFEGANTYDQFSQAYRHSLPYDSRPAEPLPDMPRHNSTSALHGAGGPVGAYGGGHGSSYDRPYDASESYAESQPLYFSQQAQRNLYLDPQPQSPTSTKTLPESSTGHLTWQLAVDNSTSFSSAATGPNDSIIPPSSAASASVTVKAPEVEVEIVQPALSAVAQGKRPAEGEKKKSQKRSLSAVSSNARPSAAAGGDGADKPGEVKKAPLACHFCRKRKLKCVFIRPA